MFNLPFDTQTITRALEAWERTANALERIAQAAERIARQQADAGRWLSQ